MGPKGKSKPTSENLMTPPTIDLDHLPLVDQQYKIIETNYEFNLFELYNWPK